LLRATQTASRYDRRENHAGAITAALYVEHFVSDRTPWVHIDFMAWNGCERRGGQSGAILRQFGRFFVTSSKSTHARAISCAGACIATSARLVSQALPVGQPSLGLHSSSRVVRLRRAIRRVYTEPRSTS
jgi:hypothetical protein